MDQPSNLRDDLDIIRELVGRELLYRTIFARSALVTGILSLVTAGTIYWNNEVHPFLGRAVRPREFVVAWMVVFVVSALANIYLLRRAAATSGRDLVSPGMRLAFRAIIPNVLIPALFTVWFFQTGYLGAQEMQLVGVWVAFYGLALLSTVLFAPRSVGFLGWAFLMASLSIPVLSGLIDDLTDDAPDSIMGVTFGVFNLVCAIFTWPRRTSSATEVSR